MNNLWMTKISHLLHMGITPLAKAVGIASGITIATMMFLVTVDVLLRYLFNHPITGSYEVISLMLVIVTFTALAHTGLKDGHIKVELLVSRLPQRAQAVINPCIYLLTLCLFAIVSWRAVVMGQRWQEIGHSSIGLEIPLYPFLYVIAFASAVFCLVLAAKLLDSLTQVVRGGWQLWSWLLLGSVLVLMLFLVPFWVQWEMSLTTIGIIGLVVMLLLIFLKVPVAFSFMLVGFIGVSLLTSLDTGLDFMALKSYHTSYSYGLTVVPLFILMGMYAFYSGLGGNLFFSADKWLGHLPGGLAIATIGACAGFSAICGSTIATAATMGSVALPEMEKHKYAPSLATGTVATGGTLGILIPPSTILIVYGILTEQPIGALFMAGILPGLLLAFLLMTTIYTICRRNPQLGPRGAITSFREKLTALPSLGGVLVLFVLIIGGIYLGVFTPSEGAGVGAFLVFLFLLLKRVNIRKNFMSSLAQATEITGMTMIILVGAMMMGYFLGLTRIPILLADFAAGLEVNRYLILAIILLFFIGMGCMMDSLAMLTLTMPIIFPVVMALGFDPIWFGVIIVVILEMGAITPPVGINVYVISGIAKHVPLHVIFRGIFPFLIPLFICAGLLVAFPQIALFLPNLLR